MDSEVIRLERCVHCEHSVDTNAQFCSQCGRSAKRTTPDTGRARDVIAQFARGTFEEAKVLASSTLKSGTGQKLAAGAVLGAAAGLALPVLTIGTGAVLGAGYVAFKRLTK
jgi:hypothetical protein